jgi:hypothetical protein
MTEIRFVTVGGKPNTHNIYYDDWTYQINSSRDVSGYEITDFETVNAAYISEHPEDTEEQGE